MSVTKDEFKLAVSELREGLAGKFGMLGLLDTAERYANEQRQKAGLLASDKEAMSVSIQTQSQRLAAAEAKVADLQKQLESEQQKHSSQLSRLANPAARERNAQAELEFLVPGKVSGSKTETYDDRLAQFRRVFPRLLPDFVKTVNRLKTPGFFARALGSKETSMMLHQDAFAAGYHADEFTLFGMAIKWCGLYGIDVHVTGTNHETF